MIDFQELLSFEVLVWVVPCALVCLALGAVLGREFAIRKMTRRLRRERTFLVKTVKTMLESTEQLSSDVGSHSSDLTSMHEIVQETPSTGDLEPLQVILLEKIGEMVAANRRLEDDLVVTRYKLDEQAQLLDHSRLEARKDQLSGLGNRKSFDEAIKYAISNYKSNDTPFALVLADVDHFKRINDTHGHQSGDKVVSRIGQTLRQLCRDHDHIARYGGDEFAIIFMKVGKEHAESAAARIRTAVEQTNFSVGGNGGRISVTFSLGMAFPSKSDTVETIIARADRALYESKRRGRNQLQVYDESMQAVAEDQVFDPYARQANSDKESLGGASEAFVSNEVTVQS